MERQLGQTNLHAEYRKIRHEARVNKLQAVGLATLALLAQAPTVLAAAHPNYGEAVMPGTFATMAFGLGTAMKFQRGRELSKNAKTIKQTIARTSQL